MMKGILLRITNIIEGKKGQGERSGILRISNFAREQLCLRRRGRDYKVLQFGIKTCALFMKTIDPSVLDNGDSENVAKVTLKARENKIIEIVESICYKCT